MGDLPPRSKTPDHLGEIKRRDRVDVERRARHEHVPAPVLQSSRVGDEPKDIVAGAVKAGASELAKAVASDALKAVPADKKEIAGRSLGNTLVNLGAIAEDVTMWARVLVSVPRNAVGLVARVARKWREKPAQRRARISPKLLLEAAAGYATAIDDELKIRYERLLDSALDVESAPRVHPAFANILGEMTGLEARILDLIGTGGIFESYQELIDAIAVRTDARKIQVAFQNLSRTGLVTIVEGDLLKVAAQEGAARRSMTAAGVEMHLYEERRVQIIGLPDGDATSVRAMVTVVYKITPLGRDFVAVVGQHQAR
jgi:hypothetical protein